MRLLFAAQASNLDKLRHVPRQTWLNIGLFLICIVAIARVWRTLRSWNDYAPYLVSGVVASGIFFYWVYSRTEPAFLTPIVERLTPFFPSQRPGS
jgi:drug/metabolite transporter (DMT)-like permease